MRKKINDIHYFLTHSKLDTRSKIKQLIKNYSYKDNEYLIAGSWAIETISGIQLNHSDIDLIFISTPSLYIDDATIEEEKCFGELPLGEEYFKKTQIKSNFFDEEIFIPSLNFQIAMKIIGELNSKFTERAQKQIALLLDNYTSFNKEQSFKELQYIFRKTTPSTLDHNEIAHEIVKAISLWKESKQEAMKKVVQIHSITNTKLREEFSRRGLDKKIKISEVDI